MSYSKKPDMRYTASCISCAYLSSPRRRRPLWRLEVLHRQVLVADFASYLSPLAAQQPTRPLSVRMVQRMALQSYEPAHIWAANMNCMHKPMHTCAPGLISRRLLPKVPRKQVKGALQRQQCQRLDGLALNRQLLPYSRRRHAARAWRFAHCRRHSRHVASTSSAHAGRPPPSYELLYTRDAPCRIHLAPQRSSQVHKSQGRGDFL